MKYSGDPINEYMLGGGYDRYGEKRNEYRILVGKPEGWMTYGRTRSRLED